MLARGVSLIGKRLEESVCSSKGGLPSLLVPDEML